MKQISNRWRPIKQAIQRCYNGNSIAIKRLFKRQMDKVHHVTNTHDVAEVGQSQRSGKGKEVLKTQVKSRQVTIMVQTCTNPDF